jgi:hypothetical protein
VAPADSAGDWIMVADSANRLHIISLQSESRKGIAVWTPTCNFQDFRALNRRE